MTELPDRLLRRALHDEASTTPSEMCVDADALAAWADGTMKGADRAAFESHAAGCARCQALIAAMVRTEPPPIEPAWWRRQPFAWLVPLATVTALAVVIVDLTMNQRESPRQFQTNARIERAPADGGAPSAPAAAPAQRRENPAANRETRPQAPPARAKSSNAAALPPAPPKTEPTTRDGLDRGALAPPAAGAPAPVAAPPPPAAQPVTVPPPPAPVADAASRRDASGAGGRGGDERARAATANKLAAAPAAMKLASGPIVIASPDRNSLWRIVDGKIDRSVDGGVSWQPRPLDATTPVRAGSAPAARVCWLAGAGGLVLLTTDGGDNWVRTAFPEPLDLVSIQATDALHATVTAAGGRRFRTADGGRIWSPEGS
jgi:Photosynthesis system II assembly factor YCF48/Putative zinc-finger